MVSKGLFYDHINLFYRWTDNEVIAHNFVFSNRILYFLMHQFIYFGIFYKKVSDYINQNIINLEGN